MKNGLFITLEGTEGAGKSSHITFLQDYYLAKGREVLITREPGGTKLGEGIRELLLSKEQTGMSNETELLLMFAARAQHVEQVIKPALAANKIVICDRFTDSSYAYQGGGRGLSSDRIKTLEDWVLSGFKPDLTLLFDLPVEVGLNRARKRGEADRFEIETVNFFQNVRDTFLEIANNEPDRVSVIDAEPPIEKVQTAIEQVLKQKDMA